MQTKQELIAKIEELKTSLEEAHEEIDGMREPIIESYEDPYE